MARQRAVSTSAALRIAFGPRALSWLFAGAAASLVLSAIEVTIAVLLQLFLHAIGVGVDPGGRFGAMRVGLPEVAAAVVAVAVLRSVAQLVVARSGNVAMESITARLRRLALAKLLDPDARPVAASRMSALVGEFFVKTSHFAAAAALLAASSVQAFGLAIAMFAGAPRESAIGLAGLVVVGGAVHVLGKKSRAAASRVPGELTTLTEGIERVARSFLLVRALRTQDRERARLASAVDAYESHSVRATLLGDLATATTPLAGVLLVVAVAVAAQRVLSTPGLVLLSFFYLFIRFVQTLTFAVSQLSSCYVTWPQVEETTDFVASFEPDAIARALAPADATRAREKKAEKEPIEGPPAIVFDDVAYRYDDATRDAVAGVSAEVPAGGALAIMGPSGTGKSTLLALALGVAEPTRGRVTVGGRAPRDYFEDPRVRVGFVGAEAFLVAGTVRDNLLYGSTRAATEDALWSALRAARLDGVIAKTPEKLNHVIGEDGSGLSAGEKQRLGLARALLAKPHVLVLDEVSANLDDATEAEIAETLRGLAGKTTVLLVSHRRGLVGPDMRVLSL